MFLSQDVLKVLTDYRMQFWSMSSSIENGKFWLRKGNFVVYTFFLFTLQMYFEQY